MADDKSSRLPVAPRRTTRSGSTTDVRPLNCGAGETEGGRRCPRCKQFHLRPGYCQALDPINAAQYPEFHATDKQKMPPRHRAETATLTGVTSENNDLGDSVTDNATLTPDATLSKVKSATLTDDRECEVCGLAFHPQRSTSRYCSSTCRSKAHRKSGDED